MKVGSLAALIGMDKEYRSRKAKALELAKKRKADRVKWKKEQIRAADATISTFDRYVIGTTAQERMRSRRKHFAMGEVTWEEYQNATAHERRIYLQRLDVDPQILFHVSESEQKIHRRAKAKADFEVAEHAEIHGGMSMIDVLVWGQSASQIQRNRRRAEKKERQESSGWMNEEAHAKAELSKTLPWWRYDEKYDVVLRESVREERRERQAERRESRRKWRTSPKRWNDSYDRDGSFEEGW